MRWSSAPFLALSLVMVGSASAVGQDDAEVAPVEPEAVAPATISVRSPADLTTLGEHLIERFGEDAVSRVTSRTLVGVLGRLLQA